MHGLFLRDHHSVAADRISMTLVTAQSGGATERQHKGQTGQGPSIQSNRRGIPMSCPTLPICHPVGRHIRLPRETVILSRNSVCCRVSANPAFAICLLA